MIIDILTDRLLERLKENPSPAKNCETNITCSVFDV